MSDEFSLAQSAAQFVQKQTLLRPTVGIVLGSGLGAFAGGLTDAVCIPYPNIPGFPKSTVVGHAGQLVLGNAGDIQVAVMQGRVHLYEGYSAAQVAFPMRVLWAMGIRATVLTNAAGGINPAYRQGALVLISDHINLQGTNPLLGLNEERFGPRFPDMTDAYSPAFRDAAIAAAARLGLELHQGIYAGLLGPSYETPAEIRYLRLIGADLVGMSTISEAIAARHMGIGVLGISCVTNMAAGLSGGAIDHAEVLATGQRVQCDLSRLLNAVLPAIVPRAKA